MLRITSGLRTAVRMNLVAVAAAGLLIAGSSGIAAAAIGPAPIVNCVSYVHGLGMPTAQGCNPVCSPRGLLPCRL